MSANTLKVATTHTVDAAGVIDGLEFNEAVEAVAGQTFVATSDTQIELANGVAATWIEINGEVVPVSGYYNDDGGALVHAVDTAHADEETGTTAIEGSQAGYFSKVDGTLGIGADAKFAADSIVTVGINISNQENANTAITDIQSAIDKVSAERSMLGAVQNRLDHTINNLGTSSENLTAAESRIRDIDMAKEMMDFTKNNILTQAAQAMMAQSNQMPEGVLQLLR